MPNRRLIPSSYSRGFTGAERENTKKADKIQLLQGKGDHTAQKKKKLGLLFGRV